MQYGYNGKILKVDLSGGTFSIDKPDESFYRKYMGGSALALYYMLTECPARIDPLEANNLLIFALSVATGAPISGQSRVTVTAKSPLTNAIGDSQAGGFWPAELKRAGYDAIVIKGRSNRPVYLWIHDGEVELRDADHLWGKVTGDAEVTLKQELKDEKIQIAQIGPAGEKGVCFAAIMNMCNRANGRTGMGAVMGSKLLKAIAVRGKGKIHIADPQKLAKFAKDGAQLFASDPGFQGVHNFGTAGDVAWQHMSGGLPTRNFTEGQFEGYEQITGERMAQTILKDTDTCYACTLRCKRVVEVEPGPWRLDPVYGGPEYETIAAFGSYCGVDNLPAIAYANQLCNMYGLDTISCGATVAFAMECFESGLLTIQDTGGLDLRFGNAEAMVELVRMIANRQGLGDLLAEGSERAAAQIGRSADQYVITSKRQEAPAHMPQVKPTMGLIYAVNPFGADHCSATHDTEYTPESGERYLRFLGELDLLDPQPQTSLNDEKVKYAAFTQRLHSLMDSLCFCLFVHGIWGAYGPKDVVEIITAVTGWDVSLFELMKVGERRINLMRIFNAREGIDRYQDTLPKKFFEPLKGQGPSAGTSITKNTFDQALVSYYEINGWDKNTGWPTPIKLKELRLGWAIDYLPKK
jgi:aldehyde:ferredoxin oxidoreductase